MAGRVRHLLEREGRFFARLVVPKELRSYVGKTELREPLGPDRRTAIRLLPGAVAELQHKIALAELQREEREGPATRTGLRYPMAHEEIARSVYSRRLAADDRLRNATADYARQGVSPEWLQQLRLGTAGALDDVTMHELVGLLINNFRHNENTDAKIGTPEWRALARLICAAMLEAAQRTEERNAGHLEGVPTSPIFQPPPESIPVKPVSLSGLFDDYVSAKQAVGKGAEAARRWRPVFDNLRRFLGHDDVLRMTKADVLAWRDECLLNLSANTVGGVYLAALRTILAWGVANDRIDVNVAASVRQEKTRRIRNRERGYTDAEAVKVLRAALSYQSSPKEAPEIAAAKRWVPILAAFSGARVGEIAQLRREDFRLEGDLIIMRIQPDAGTVKTSQYRDVPLHTQIIECGLLFFLEGKSGPLFYRSITGQDALKAVRITSNTVAKWMKSMGLVPDDVSPNHGWRHRFKTVGREVGIPDRVLDAIQGHAAKTAGDDYGDVRITTKARWIKELPRYSLPSASVAE